VMRHIEEQRAAARSAAAAARRADTAWDPTRDPQEDEA